jgi:hypothetical protein
MRSARTPSRSENGEQAGSENAECPGQPAPLRGGRLANHAARSSQPGEGLEGLEEGGARGGEEHAEASEQDSPSGEPGEAGLPEPRQRTAGERILSEARRRKASQRQRCGYHEAGPEQADTRPHQPVATLLGEPDPEAEQQGARQEQEPHQSTPLVPEFP